MRKTTVKTKASADSPDPSAPLTSLKSIMEAIKDTNPDPVTVDITAFLQSSQEGGKTILTWQMPSIPRAYAIADDAAVFMRSNSDWKPQLAYDVATLAACHVAPESGEISVGAFYTMICKTNNDLWVYLMEELRRVFPQLKS